MYAEDSFFTLSATGRLGLVLLSLLLFAAIVCVMHRISRGLPYLAALSLAFIAFWVFEWLSPQIYYLYYVAYFDNLPFQNVVQFPPSAMSLLQLITFQAEPTLSAHGRGCLAWAMIAETFLARRCSRT
jgi:hypothetical protein